MDQGGGPSKGSEDEEGGSAVGRCGAGGGVAWPRAASQIRRPRPRWEQTGATHAVPRRGRARAHGRGGHLTTHPRGTRSTAICARVMEGGVGEPGHGEGSRAGVRLGGGLVRAELSTVFDVDIGRATMRSCAW